MSGPGVVVVVSGLPAAGKSTLAATLRDRLALPLLGLDTVKEALVDGLAGDAPSDRFAIRRAARDVVVALAAANPAGCVIDIWINPTRDGSGFAQALRGLPGVRFVEVVCRVPVEVSLARYAARERHPAHLPMDPGTEERIRAAAPHLGPLGLGPHLDVDTTTPVVGGRVDDLVAWVRG